MSDLLRVKATFALLGPATRMVRKGTIVAASDPVVKGREHLFEVVAPTPAASAPSHSAPVVEAATAAPGEKRTVTPRKAKA